MEPVHFALAEGEQLVVTLVNGAMVAEFSVPGFDESGLVHHGTLTGPADAPLLVSPRDA